MKLLVLDFLKRWKWIFIVSLVLTVLSGVGGMPFVFAPAAVIVLLLDAQRGVFRVIRPLPVPRLEQARTWWFIGVPLLPLLSVPALIAGGLLCQQFNPTAAFSTRFLPPPMVASARPAEGPGAPTIGQAQPSSPVPEPRKPGPWFAVGVQWWVAFGYAGFCFFLLQWAPIRPAESFAEHVQQGLFGGLWGLSCPGVAFLLPALPRTPDAVQTWHWFVFAAAPIFVAFSYISAAELLRRRMAVTTVKSRPATAPDAHETSRGMTGIPFFLATFPGRVAIFVAIIAAVQIAVFRWMMSGKITQANPVLGVQVSLMGLTIAAIVSESVGLRALRSLPISSRTLALLLAAPPAVAGVVSAVFAALFARPADSHLSGEISFLALAISLVGWGIFAMACMLHISSGARLFVLILLLMIPSVALQIAFKNLVPIAFVGALVGAIGFAMLERGLRKSPVFYQPRGFFGVTPGQPGPVR